MLIVLGLNNFWTKDCCWLDNFGPWTFINTVVTLILLYSWTSATSNATTMPVSLLYWEWPFTEILVCSGPVVAPFPLWDREEIVYSCRGWARTRQQVINSSAGQLLEQAGGREAQLHTWVISWAKATLFLVAEFRIGVVTLCPWGQDVQPQDLWESTAVQIQLFQCAACVNRDFLFWGGGQVTGGLPVRPNLNCVLEEEFEVQCCEKEFPEFMFLSISHTKYSFRSTWNTT